MNHLLMRLIQEEMTLGPASTFAERMYNSLARHFAEIKSEALKEIMDNMRKKHKEALAELEHRQTTINSLKKTIEELRK